MINEKDVNPLQDLTIDDFAAERKVTPRHVRNEIKRGNAPDVYYIGASVRMRRCDVDAWLDAKVEVEKARRAEDLSQWQDEKTLVETKQHAESSYKAVQVDSGSKVGDVGDLGEKS